MDPSMGYSMSTKWHVPPLIRAGLCVVIAELVEADKQDKVLYTNVDEKTYKTLKSKREIHSVSSKSSGIIYRLRETVTNSLLILTWSIWRGSWLCHFSNFCFLINVHMPSRSVDAPTPGISVITKCCPS